jgi:hypothetical protein
VRVGPQRLTGALQLLTDVTGEVDRRVLPRLRLGVEEHLPGKVSRGVGRRRPGKARNLVEVDAASLVEDVEERVGRVLDVRLFLAGDDGFEEDAALLGRAGLVVVMLDRAEPVILRVLLEGVDVRPLLDDGVGHLLVGEGAVAPLLALRLVLGLHVGTDAGDVGNAAPLS